MVYRNELTTKIRSYLWYSAILVACIFGSCTKRSAVTNNECFTTSECLELVYQRPNSFACTLSLKDSVLSYSYDLRDYNFTGYKCRIRPQKISATHKDISAFFNDTNFYECKLQVSENMEIVGGRKAQVIAEHLVGILLLNSPIILFRDDNGYFDTKDNSLYHYNEDPAWHTIEVSVGFSGYPGSYYLPTEKIVIREDSLSYLYEGERTSKILQPEEKAKIRNLLSRINLNSTFQSCIEAVDLPGFQIKVNDKIIYTNYPSDEFNSIAGGIYSDLLVYIIQLSPKPFTYEDFGY